MRPLEREYDAQRPVIEAIQAGDPHAMAEFIRAHGRWVRAIVFGVLGRAADLDDACQKVWIAVWRQCRNLEDPNRWRPWLYRIARNAATDGLRRAQRRRRLSGPSLSQDEVVLPASGGDCRSPDRMAVLNEQQQAMMKAIADLPAIYREPFVLRHVEGWSYARIGETMGLPTDTVETRLVRARRLLRDKLKDKI